MGIRFRAPHLAAPEDLRWVLEAAFGQASPGSLEPSAAAAAAQRAVQCDLASRIIMRRGRRQVAGWLGPAAEKLSRNAYRNLILQERTVETIRIITETGESEAIPLAFIKAAALRIANHAPLGWRNAGDVDVLLPEAFARRFWSALQRRGWCSVGNAPGDDDHALPLLAHPRHSRIEVHWCLNGLDIAGPSRSATFSDLVRANLLVPADHGTNMAFVPIRAALLAQAVIHVIAQHGLGIDYPYFRLVSDIIDLGYTRPGQDMPPPEWYQRAVAPSEMDAAIRLAGRLEASDPELLRESEAGASTEGDLLRHFVAAACLPDYPSSLRLRQAFHVLADTPATGVLIRRIARTLFPDTNELARIYGADRGILGRLTRRALHPVIVVTRAAGRHFHSSPGSPA